MLFPLQLLDEIENENSMGDGILHYNLLLYRTCYYYYFVKILCGSYAAENLRTGFEFQRDT